MNAEHASTSNSSIIIPAPQSYQNHDDKSKFDTQRRNSCPVHSLLGLIHTSAIKQEHFNEPPPVFTCEPSDHLPFSPVQAEDETEQESFTHYTVSSKLGDKVLKAPTSILYSPSTFLPAIRLCILLVIFTTRVSTTFAQSKARCYYFGPGMTIPGSEYRRDYGIERKVCAETCKLDSCCMAFEWREKDGICTLKSRSVNGSVTPAEDDTYFGLCLDYEDAERDRLWDHEIIGPSVASVARISREKCSVMCAEAAPAAIRKRTMDPLHIGQSAMKGKPVFYSWKTENERDVDSELGTCQCVTVLKEVKLSFGSFSGFLM
ncbi:PAN domain protein [Ditylenchus destructor]|uniref:PAN domain protein n=1 Tax=Ditylenchus destructor TaxID=166010 RepID=A0AAD4NFY4_9BILA|nr:PAN domain protein [Ditylenchus destructor]